MTADTLSETVLILAPFGRDADIAVRVLSSANIAAQPCANLGDLLQRMVAGAGMAIVTDDAVINADLTALSEWLQRQSSWSDFPFIILAAKGGGPERNVEALRLMEIFGNVNFLERPFHPTTLVSMAQSGLRSRRRQYETRRNLLQLETASTRLEESEEARMAALEAAGVGTWAFFPDENQLVWDNMCRALFGLAPDVPIDLDHCMTLIAEADRNHVANNVNEAVTPGFQGLYHVEFRVGAGNGREQRWLAASGRLQEDKATGRRLAGSVWDISEKKQAELNLQELNETLAQQVQERTRERDSMWNLSTDLMLVTQFDGKTIAVNPAWERLLGWTAADLAGRSIIELVHEEDLAATQAELANLADGKTTPHFENRYRHRDGTWRWISWMAVPRSDYLYATGRDISEEKKANETLRLVGEQLRQAQKMEAVGQLTGGIAHDFNNLLAGISGSVELARIRISQGRFTELDRYMEAAWSSVQKAAALTHRLLAFSRRQTLDARTTDVNVLVTSMADMLRRTIGPDIDFRTRLVPEPWATQCDPNQLESALLNLAINARDAMPDGGKLFIETANTELDEAYTKTQSDVTPGPYVSISVTDTGIGMPDDVVARAFDPFFTTKPIGQGTGLGLSMVYGFVKQSGGHIRIYSEEGNGTTITIYLPQSAENKADARDAGHHGQPVTARNGETILVVDDEVLIRSVVSEALEDLGYRVLLAETGADGLAIIKGGARVDLLITDVGLPGGMNGRQFADAARQQRPDLKVLYITGYAAHAALETTLVQGNVELLTKPFAVEALAEKTRTMLGYPASVAVD